VQVDGHAGLQHVEFDDRRCVTETGAPVAGLLREGR
jgi:hypothetical protein